jgi:hypothetical protein
MSTISEEEELREALSKLASEPRTRFFEVRGSDGLDLRLPLDTLMNLLRSLEERAMWLTLERDKAVAVAAEAKDAAKAKTKRAGEEIARLRKLLSAKGTTDASQDDRPA